MQKDDSFVVTDFAGAHRLGVFALVPAITTAASLAGLAGFEDIARELFRLSARAHRAAMRYATDHGESMPSPSSAERIAAGKKKA